MKQSIRKITLALVACSLLLTGCADTPSVEDDTTGSTAQEGTSNADSADSEDAYYSAPGEFPIVEEPITIEFFVSQGSAVTDYNENTLTQKVESVTGVDIEWTVVPSSDATSKRNLMLASGESLPDVFFGGMDDSTVVQYAEQGVFIPLEGLIEEHMPNLSALMAEDELLSPMITSIDGSIYGLPNKNVSYGNFYAQCMFIQGAWLEAVDMEMPTTTDELYDVLKAFKDQDPNGNGEQDEIPLASSADQPITGFLMMPFIYSDGGNYLYIEDDGTLQFAYTQEEWREGLRYIKMLIDEGLVHPISLTQDGAQMKQLTEMGDVPTVGSSLSFGLSSFTDTAGTRIWDYAYVVEAIEGPDGVKQARYNPYASYGLNQYVITNSCEHPEVAAKLADYMYSEEISMWNRFGEPGVDHKTSDMFEEGAVDLVGNSPPLYEEITPWGSPAAIHWQSVGPGNRTQAMIDGEFTDPEIMTQKRLKWEQFPTAYEPYGVSQVPPIKFTADESRDMAQITAVTDAYFDEMTALFLTGGMDLDKDWDAYIAELENMGLSEVLKIYNEAYARQWG